jgi:hypothetical protein
MIRRTWGEAGGDDDASIVLLSIVFYAYRFIYTYILDEEFAHHNFL